jgi:magnesium-transporting ATPase (P-type)
VAYVNFHALIHWLGLSEFEARNRLFLLLVLVMNYHVFNCRSEYVSAFRVPLARNRILVAGVLVAQAIHIAAMFWPPAQAVLKVAPVSLGEWLAPFAMASIIVAAMELFKWGRHGRAIAWPRD